MGFYINPTDMSKEQWLHKNQKSVSVHPPTKNYLEHDDTVCVVLVDNFAFSALAIAYNMRELEDFSRDDGRMKVWAQVPRAVVEPYLHGQKIEGVKY